MQSHIAARAYQLYEQNGRKDGDDKAHWLQAETEIIAKVPEIHNSGALLAVTIPMKGISSHQIQICMEPHQAIIMIEKEHTQPSEFHSSQGPDLSTIFSVVNWPDEVDPFAASAFLREDRLTLTVKRARPAVNPEGGHSATIAR
jgi:HSP20 family molecular chaperone IbpA